MIAIDYLVGKMLVENSILWNFSGGTIAPLFDSCHRLGVRTLTTRSEHGAGFAAIGAYKATRRIQFVAATSGPGATNLVTAIADAYYDSSAIVFLTGQVATSNLVGHTRQMGFQHTDIVSIVKPITKFASMCVSAIDLRKKVDIAIVEATSGRPGPCLLDLPMNVQIEELVQ